MRIDRLDVMHPGHATFVIVGEKTVYIDPYVLPASPKKADLILITHPHYDHCDPGKVSLIRKADTVIVATADCAKMLSGDVRAIKPGQTIKVGDIEVRAVPAYNVGKPFHPKANGWVGFILKVGGTTLYHAGDTDFIPEMKEIKADIALLPIGGTYTMDVEQAVQAALAIKPRIVIPMHYNAIEGTEANPKEFKRKINEKNPNIKVEVL
jgi:L-ascorbate metabolism protein UlaG (beta-lactamase superfamily)